MTLGDKLYDAWYSTCKAAVNIIAQYDIQIKGNVPPQDAIIAATHSSYLDAPSLVLGLDRKMVFPSVWQSFPWVGWVDVTQGVTKETVEEITDYMGRGYSLGIFPEGRRNTEGEISQTKRGAFFFARHFNRPLVPVSIKGTSDLWVKGERLPRSLCGKIILNCGEPFDYKGKGTEWAPRLTSELQRLYNES